MNREFNRLMLQYAIGFIEYGPYNESCSKTECINWLKRLVEEADYTPGLTSDKQLELYKKAKEYTDKRMAEMPPLNKANHVRDAIYSAYLIGAGIRAGFSDE